MCSLFTNSDTSSIYASNNSALNVKSNICHENFTPGIVRSSKVAVSMCHLWYTGYILVYCDADIVAFI